MYEYNCKGRIHCKEGTTNLQAQSVQGILLLHPVRYFRVGLLVRQHLLGTRLPHIKYQPSYSVLERNMMDEKAISTMAGFRLYVFVLFSDKSPFQRALYHHIGKQKATYLKGNCEMSQNTNDPKKFSFQQAQLKINCIIHQKKGITQLGPL